MNILLTPAKVNYQRPIKNGFITMSAAFRILP